MHIAFGKNSSYWLC